MNNTVITKQEFDSCSRNLVLMFNRVMMYRIGHPHVDQVIDSFYPILQKLLKKVSPLSFIHHHEQFFIEQEPVDPRINTERIKQYFKKTGVQSVSFEEGIDKNEIRAFLEVYDAPNKYPDADAMKKKLQVRRVQHLKINHVVFIKATEDDELVSRDAIRTMSPELSKEAQIKSKKLFLDTILQSALSEEFEKIFALENLVNNPAGLSKNMVAADLAGFRENSEKGVQPGQVLLHQLDMVGREVDRNLCSEEGADLPKMAAAVLDMEKQLKKEIEVQKTNEIIYPNETEIFDKAAEIKDKVLIQAIKDKSKAGGISTAQTQQLVQEFGFGENDMPRILPKIKTAIADTTIGVENLLKNPAEFSKNMVQADLAGFRKSEARESCPGQMLLRHLEILKKDVEKNLYRENEARLPDVISALFDMKKHLMAELERQKALKVTYANEDEILGKVDDIADSAILQMVKIKYRSGRFSTPGLAQIIRRLVPKADELKRLLPKIKTTLLGEGMPLSEYTSLVRELGTEPQNKELARILQSGAEEIGVSGESLIQEIRKDPVQTSALIALAAKIRNSTGDEKMLSDLLVDYIEQLGSEGKLDISKEDVEKGDQHLRKVISDIESKIFGQLRDMNVKDDIASQLEKRLNDRMDEIFEKVKWEIIQSTSAAGAKDSLAGLSILEILMQNVDDGDDLAEILEIIRTRARSEDIDVNSFTEIFAQIVKEQKRRTEGRREQASKEILEPRAMMAFLEQEMFRAKRFRLPFVVLAFSLVSARPKTDAPVDAVSQWHLENAILDKLLTAVRDADAVGMFGMSRIGVLLPHTLSGGGKVALDRCIRQIHSEPLLLNGIPFEFRMAGVHSEFDLAKAPDIKVFVEALLNELMNLEVRLKNIQAVM